MIISRVNTRFLRLALLGGALLWALPAAATSDDREASFLPPPEAALSPAPVVAAPASASVSSAVSVPVTSAPVTSVPVETPPGDLVPVDMGTPVATEVLAPVDPDGVGLLTASAGGLPVALWEGTPRALVERLLGEPGFVPTASPALNDLARRMLLSTAAVPAGASAVNRSLTSLRLEKLLALGAVSEAWQLALLAKDAHVDDAVLRQVTEAMLIGPDSKVVCDKMPEIMAGHSGGDWQKAQVVCQLRSGDMKASQLSLDLMREQQVKDEVFMTLASRNVLGGVKQLPRQLTPLRATSLALLRQVDLPLPPELFARPDAALIPELLQAKAADDKDRLALASRAAARGMIGSAQLAAVYGSVAFTPDNLANATGGGESGPRFEALLYQAARQETVPQKRVELVRKWAEAMDTASLCGAAGQLLAEQVATLPVTSDNNMFAATAARVMALAGKPDQALAWLKLAYGSASKLPEVAATLQNNWPLFVLSGLVTDAEYGQGLKGWLDAALTPAAGEDAEKAALDSKESRARRQKAGAVLLLLNAAGFAVPEEQWVRVAETAAESKRFAMPSPVLLERLRSAGVGNRRGEAVALSVLLAGGGAADTPLFVITDAVRSLRQIGLTADALALARETAAGQLTTP